MGQTLHQLEAVMISTEMTAVVGIGDMSGIAVPAHATVLTFSLGCFNSPATVRITTSDGSEPLGLTADGAASLSLFVSPGALDRLFGWSPDSEHGKRYHLTSELREIALALRDCPAGAARTAYRGAKSVELLCEAAQLLAAGSLVLVAGDGTLSLADSRRLVDARRIIDERWSEKLTLDGLARACGINRAKLTRGFRELYRCSVAEALAERRLNEASRRLLSTDLPVATIGYDSGYLNNASFARAFGRRFGVSPSEYRGRGASLAA